MYSIQSITKSPSLSATQSPTNKHCINKYISEGDCFIIIIIKTVFVNQYKTKQNHKLQINLESAVYTLKCRKKEKVEWELFDGSDSSSSL